MRFALLLNVTCGRVPVRAIRRKQERPSLLLELVKFFPLGRGVSLEVERVDFGELLRGGLVDEAVLRQQGLPLELFGNDDNLQLLPAPIGPEKEAGS